MSKFKVGDTVRRIEDGSNGNAVTKGNLYEVKEVYGSSIIVIDDTGKRDGFCIKKFELVSSPSTELTSLPQKWCIKITDENWEKVFKWAGFHFSRNGGEQYVSHYKTHSKENNWFNNGNKPLPEITFDQFKKWVLKEKSEVKSTYGLNIGDTVDQKDLSEWCKVEDNWSSEGSWEEYHSGVHGDRKILGFKEIQGKVGFQVYGTSLDVYFRAEGFKDFVAKRNTVAPTPDETHKTESLLEEAKRRYPVGTKYHIAHLSADGKTTAIVRNPNAFFLHDGNVYESHGNYGANGHSYSEILYHRNNEKWAEIISRPEERSSIYWECIQPSYYNPPAFKLGTVYKQKGELTGFDTINFEEDSLGSKTNGWSKEFFKPSTREAYDAQFKKEEKIDVGWLKREAERRYKEGDVVQQGVAYEMSYIEHTIGSNLSASVTVDSHNVVNVAIGGVGVWHSTVQIWAPVVKRAPASLDSGTLSSGFLSPDVGPIWNKGLRDYPSSYSGSGVPPLKLKMHKPLPMIFGTGGEGFLGSIDPWEDFELGMPKSMIHREVMSVEDCFDRYGILFDKYSPKPQPSSKVSVNTHEEFKITINKPKTIKI